MPNPYWPEGLSRIAVIIGEAETLVLASCYGGTSGTYIPAKATPGHPWSKVLSGDSWKLICAELGGQRVDLPRGCFIKLKKVMILDLNEQGLSQRDIALRARVTMRYVGQVLALVRDERQVEMFH